jgi:Integrase core domain
VLTGPVLNDFAQVQARFDQWRQVYNHERPHQALGMAVPASRYQGSWLPSSSGQHALRCGRVKLSAKRSSSTR